MSPSYSTLAIYLNLILNFTSPHNPHLHYIYLSSLIFHSTLILYLAPRNTPASTTSSSCSILHPRMQSRNYHNSSGHNRRATMSSSLLLGRDITRNPLLSVFVQLMLQSYVCALIAMMVCQLIPVFILSIPFILPLFYSFMHHIHHIHSFIC